MSSIGGPGGIGGPKGPSGPAGPGDIDAVEPETSVDATTATKAAGELEAMAADIAAGRLTAREAVDKLVDEIAGNQQLGSTERAELRELLTDMVENDPYLQSLVGRV
jgi:hypothetical protein